MQPRTPWRPQTDIAQSSVFSEYATHGEMAKNSTSIPFLPDVIQELDKHFHPNTHFQKADRRRHAWDVSKQSAPSIEPGPFVAYMTELLITGRRAEETDTHFDLPSPPSGKQSGISAAWTMR